jgi:hypothetical protein
MDKDGKETLFLPFFSFEDEIENVSVLFFANPEV